jgi:hypothetical protein
MARKEVFILKHISWQEWKDPLVLTTRPVVWEIIAVSVAPFVSHWIDP